MSFRPIPFGCQTHGTASLFLVVPVLSCSKMAAQHSDDNQDNHDNSDNDDNESSHSEYRTNGK